MDNDQLVNFNIPDEPKGLDRFTFLLLKKHFENNPPPVPTIEEIIEINKWMVTKMAKDHGLTVEEFITFLLGESNESD